jgi:hypothetical protein
MQSAVVSAGTIAITYNEAVSCAAAADADFVYDYTGTTSGGSFTGCSGLGDVITLTGAFTLPGASGGSIIYTSPASPTTSNAVFATTDFPQFPASQTLTLAAVTAPTIVGVAQTGADQITVTYSENVSCGAATAADFSYYSTGSTSGLGTGTVTASCAGTTALVLNSTAAFVVPTSSATIVYTAPATPTATTAVSAVGTTVYAATQTYAFGIPFMVSAVVATGTIAITWSQPVFCPATFSAADFVYDYTISVSGGMPTGCTSSGDVTTLAGAFNAPLGSASQTLRARSTRQARRRSRVPRSPANKVTKAF